LNSSKRQIPPRGWLTTGVVRIMPQRHRPKKLKKRALYLDHARGCWRDVDHGGDTSPAIVQAIRTKFARRKQFVTGNSESQDFRPKGKNYRTTRFCLPRFRNGWFFGKVGSWVRRGRETGRICWSRSYAKKEKKEEKREEKRQTFRLGKKQKKTGKGAAGHWCWANRFTSGGTPSVLRTRNLEHFSRSTVYPCKSSNGQLEPALARPGRRKHSSQSLF